MSALSLNVISEIGGFLTVDGFFSNISKRFEAKLEYVKTAFKVSHLSAEIIEDLGLFSGIIKNIKASFKLPVVLFMPNTAFSIVRVACDFFKSAEHNDTESFFNSGFNFFASTIDLMGNIKALSNSLNQITKLPDAITFPGITAVLYPLSLVAAIIGIIIKIRDYMEVKFMMRSDVAVMCFSSATNKELKQFITFFLEKRLKVTANEKRIIDRETNANERVKKYDDLRFQKRSKYSRLVGAYALEQLDELNNYANGCKKYSTTETRKIVSKIRKIYEYENLKKTRQVARDVLVIISTLFLTHGALLIPGCLLLISISLSAIYDFIKNEKFYNELKSF